VLVLTLLLLTFMGDALRDALDPRKGRMNFKQIGLAPAASSLESIERRHDGAAAGVRPARRLRPKTVVEAWTSTPGEKLALVGESGSGKTVTALALLRLLGAPPGQALFEPAARPAGLARARDARLRGDDIAMIFQEPMTALNPLMTVGEQIAEVLRLKRALTPAQSRKQLLICWQNRHPRARAARGAFRSSRAASASAP
jgi:hypothetical protein